MTCLADHPLINGCLDLRPYASRGNEVCRRQSIQAPLAGCIALWSCYLAPSSRECSICPGRQRLTCLSISLEVASAYSSRVGSLPSDVSGPILEMVHSSQRSDRHSLSLSQLRSKN